MIGNNVYFKKDVLFATFKQPMKVANGNMTLTTANGLNLDDSVSFIDQNISLKPTGVEKSLTIGYLSEIGKEADILVLLNHRNNPNHDKSLKSDNQIMIKINAKF